MAISSWKIGLALLVGVLALFYLYVKRLYSYWDRKGFKTLPGVNYLFGHFKGILTEKLYFSEILRDFYHATTEPFIGIYSPFRPILLLNDPELIERVLIKDFTHFAERGAFFDEVHNPLSANLFGLPAQRWKTLRTKLSPTFSTAKLKAMFSTFLDCGANLQNYLDRMADTQELVEMREMSGHFTTTIIASVVFGCKADAFIDPKNEFRMCAHSLFQPNFLNRVRTFGFFAFPKLLTLLGIRLVNSKNEKFIQLMVKQNLEYREKNHIVRNDFFQLLAQLRNKGTLQDHDQSVNSITEKEIAANTFLFFFAGFESTSSILTFCVYHLAKNPEVQRRVHEEIDRVLAAHNGEINYASISNMKYLEACINEILRMYPPLSHLNRFCMKDYQIPGTNKVIEKGTLVFIPVLALQTDEKFYNEPYKFDPERFYTNASDKRIMASYLPFGGGPRNCIAMSMGKLQSKVGLLLMLQKHKFELGDELKQRELKFNPYSFFLNAHGDVRMHVFKR